MMLLVVIMSSSSLATSLPVFFPWFLYTHFFFYGSCCLQHQHAFSFCFFGQCWSSLLGCVLLLFAFFDNVDRHFGMWCLLHHHWCPRNFNVLTFHFFTLYIYIYIYIYICCFFSIFFFFFSLICLWFHVCRCSSILSCCRIFWIQVLLFLQIITIVFHFFIPCNCFFIPKFNCFFY